MPEMPTTLEQLEQLADLGVVLVGERGKWQIVAAVDDDDRPFATIRPFTRATMHVHPSLAEAVRAASEAVRSTIHQTP